MQRLQAHAEPRWNAEDIDLPDTDDSSAAGLKGSSMAGVGDSLAVDVAAGTSSEKDAVPVPQCLLVTSLSLTAWQRHRRISTSGACLRSLGEIR